MWQEVKSRAEKLYGFDVEGAVFAPQNPDDCEYDYEEYLDYVPPQN